LVPSKYYSIFASVYSFSQIHPIWGQRKNSALLFFFFQWFEKQRFGNLFPKPVFKIGGEKKAE